MTKHSFLAYRRPFWVVVAVSCLYAASVAAQTGKPKVSTSKSRSAAKKAAIKTPPKATASKAAAAKAPVGKATAGSVKRSPKANAKRGKSPAPPVKRWVQAQPSPERYKEIQEALAAKGYFRGVADGNWGEDSIEALKRFQKDQNLETDGKINSLSLIALGLGPKHGATQSGTQSNLDSSATGRDSAPEQ